MSARQRRLCFCCAAFVGLLPLLLPVPTPAQQPSPSRQFQQGLTLMETRGDLEAAIKVFQEVAKADDRSLAAHALLYLGVCYERLGRREATRVYEQIISRYPDEPGVVRQARARLASLARSSDTTTDAVTKNEIAWPKAPDGEPSRVSRDGSVIAFRSDSLFVLADPTSGAPTRRVRLNPNPPAGGTFYDPMTLSPDGSEGVITYETSDGRAQFLSVLFDTGAWRTITDLPGGEWLSGLEWTSAGLLALHTFPDGSSRTQLLDPVKASAPRTLLTHEVAPMNASLSPDGQYLVYDSPGSDGQRDIFIVSTKGDDAHALFATPADEVSPSWAADGKRVVFTSDRSGRTGIWSVEVDSGRAVGEAQQLYSDSGVMGYFLGLTANGSFYYFKQSGQVNVHRVELSAAGIPTSEPRLVTERHFGANQGSSWGPGRSLVHLSRVGQTLTQHITVHDQDGARERTLDTRMRYLRNLKWSPDGATILVKGRDGSGGYGLHFVDPTTGLTTPVFTVPAAVESSIGQIGWRNASTILFLRNGALIARTLGSGHEQRLLEPAAGGTLGRFDTLPATGAIAYVEHQVSQGTPSWSLKVLEADGTRKVLFSTSDRAIDWPTWSPDGRWLLLVRPSANVAREGEVWRLDRETGALSPLGTSMRALRNIDVSDDGRHLTFTAGSPTLQAWVLSNFLPVRTESPREAKNPALERQR